MITRRTAAAAAVTAVTAAGLLLASASTGTAQDMPNRGMAPVPGMAQMHQQMNGQELGMQRMHELHVEHNPGMARLPQLMSDGPR